MAKNNVCSHENCERIATRKGLCSKHYNFVRRFLPIERYYRGKSEANNRKIDWKLDFKDYENIIKNNCYFCDKSLKEFTGISVDRIDNDKGYYKENLLPCCPNCNMARNTFFTIEEFKIMMDALNEFRTKIQKNL